MPIKRKDRRLRHALRRLFRQQKQSGYIDAKRFLSLADDSQLSVALIPIDTKLDKSNSALNQSSNVENNKCTRNSETLTRQQGSFAYLDVQTMKRKEIRCSLGNGDENADGFWNEEQVPSATLISRVASLTSEGAEVVLFTSAKKSFNQDAHVDITFDKERQDDGDFLLCLTSRRIGRQESFQNNKESTLNETPLPQDSIPWDTFGIPFASITQQPCEFAHRGNLSSEETPANVATPVSLKNGKGLQKAGSDPPSIDYIQAEWKANVRRDAFDTFDKEENQKHDETPQAFDSEIYADNNDTRIFSVLSVDERHRSVISELTMAREFCENNTGQSPGDEDSINLNILNPACLIRFIQGNAGIHVGSGCTNRKHNWNDFWCATDTLSSESPMHSKFDYNVDKATLEGSPESTDSSTTSSSDNSSISSPNLRATKDDKESSDDSDSEGRSLELSEGGRPFAGLSTIDEAESERIANLSEHSGGNILATPQSFVVGDDDCDLSTLLSEKAQIGRFRR